MTRRAAGFGSIPPPKPCLWSLRLAPVLAQEIVELDSALFREEDPSALELDATSRSGNRLCQPARPGRMEVRIVALEIPQSPLRRDVRTEVGRGRFVGHELRVFVGRRERAPQDARLREQRVECPPEDGRRWPSRGTARTPRVASCRGRRNPCGSGYGRDLDASPRRSHRSLPRCHFRPDRRGRRRGRRETARASRRAASADSDGRARE